MEAACGLTITDKGFDSSTFDLLAAPATASSRPNRVFEVLAEVIAETGAVAGKTRRAPDSTTLDGAVACQDTVTPLIAAIRRVARNIPGAGEIVAAVTASGHAARDELVSALVGDALAALAELEARHPDSPTNTHFPAGS